MQVNTGVSEGLGKIAYLIAMGKRSTGAVVRGLFYSRGVPYSSPRLRLLLFLFMTGGNSMRVLNVYVCLGINPSVYVLVTHGLICRYGVGRGGAACYRLTDKGIRFVEELVRVLDGVADHCVQLAAESKQITNKKPRTFISRASVSRASDQ